MNKKIEFILKMKLITIRTHLTNDEWNLIGFYMVHTECLQIHGNKFDDFKIVSKRFFGISFQIKFHFLFHPIRVRAREKPQKMVKNESALSIHCVHPRYLISPARSVIVEFNWHIFSCYFKIASPIFQHIHTSNRRIGMKSKEKTEERKKKNTKNPQILPITN